MTSQTNSQASAVEVWKPAPGLEGRFEVSNFGRARSIPHETKGRGGKPVCWKGRILKLSPGNHGYYSLLAPSSQAPKGYTRVLLHRLIAEVFIGPPPFPGAQINHLDGCKVNNAVWNLEWCNQTQNMRHAAALGLLRRGEGIPTAKLNTAKVQEMRRYRAGGATLQALAAKYGVGIQTVSDVTSGRTWRHVPME